MAAEAMSVFDARARYLAASGFTDASYTDRWVVLRLGRLPFVAFPNTAGRKRAIPLHDLHHVATGYSTTFRGEAEISAWEVGAGCGNYYAAWAIDVSGLALGLVIAPRRTYRAFVRGRHSKSLYVTGPIADLHATTVDELRARLAVDAPTPPTWTDRLAFAGYVALAIGPALAAAALAAWLIAQR